MVKTKKKKPADVELIKKLMLEADVTIYKTECDLKMSKSTLLRGLKEDTDRPLPPKWEPILIKYLRKKITEKNEIEIQTEEVKREMGFVVPEKESNLKEEIKDGKKEWLIHLQ